MPPRLVGPVSEWSGLDTAHHESWLINHVKDMGFNAIWFSPMGETTKVEKLSRGKTLTGSYYASRDHFHLDKEFSSGDAAKDLKHLKHFCAKAASGGIRVYADLVFNHIAADHPLVEAEEDEIAKILMKTGGQVEPVLGNKNKLIGLSYLEGTEKKIFHFKFRRKDDFALLFGGPTEDLWSDVAQINYSSPEARRFFIEGDDAHKGYFKQVIDWYIDCGFRGFRCDVAYMIPPEAWQELIPYALQRQPDSIFLAETLGGPDHKIERLAGIVVTDSKGNERPAFDLGMTGFYWWNMKDSWLPELESPRLQRMSKFGGAGSPDNHDTEGTLAGNFSKIFNKSGRTEEIVSEICLRNYALSVLACHSSYMQMGYEYCNQKQNSVFKGMVSPEDWEALCKKRGQTPDLRDSIRTINELKENLHVENCRVIFKECAERQDGKIIKIHCEYIDVDTNQKTAEIVMLLNKNPEHGEALNGTMSAELEKSGLSKLSFGKDPDKVGSVVIYHTPIKNNPVALKPKAGSCPILKKFK